MKKYLSILLLTLLLISINAGFVTATQENVTLNEAKEVENSVDYIFGESISFQAIIQTESPVENAAIFFQAENDARTNLGDVEIEPLEDGRTRLAYKHLIADYAIRPFSRVEYRFEINLKSGEKIKSQTFRFDYLDNRFAWQSLEEAPFRVFWYDGDLAFAQSVLDVAQEGMQTLQKNLGLPLPQQNDIYIYRDPNNLLQALNPSSPGWVAGHADPDLGVVLVSIPQGAEQRQFLEQRIPHELAHLSLYHATQQGYYNIPTFLNEGLASIMELYPNQDYRTLIDHAVENDALLPISGLCQGFPRDASSALLAYAQSASFTQYIYDRFGASALQRLVSNTADGMDCEYGIQSALGLTINQLDSQWQREALAKNVLRAALYNFLPWIILLLIVVTAPVLLTVLRLRARPADSPSV